MVRVSDDAETLQQADEHEEELLSRERFSRTETLSHAESHEELTAGRRERPIFSTAREVGVRIEVIRVRPDVRLSVHCPLVGQHDRSRGDEVLADVCVLQGLMRQRERSDRGETVHFVHDGFGERKRTLVLVVRQPI